MEISARERERTLVNPRDAQTCQKQQTHPKPLTEGIIKFRNYLFGVWRVGLYYYINALSLTSCYLCTVIDYDSFSLLHRSQMLRCRSLTAGILASLTPLVFSIFFFLFLTSFRGGHNSLATSIHSFGPNGFGWLVRYAIWPVPTMWVV